MFEIFIIKRIARIGFTILTCQQSFFYFFDNGNYHYMSKLWTDSIREPFDLVVFDHHPDMQPPRFEGILSCGGWIKEVLDHNKLVQNVIVIGVADHLVDEIRQEVALDPSDARNDAPSILDKVTFIKESELGDGATLVLVHQRCGKHVTPTEGHPNADDAW